MTLSNFKISVSISTYIHELLENESIENIFKKNKNLFKKWKFKKILNKICKWTQLFCNVIKRVRTFSVLSIEKPVDCLWIESTK